MALSSRSFSMTYDDSGNRTLNYTVDNETFASDRYDGRTNSQTAYVAGQAPVSAGSVSFKGLTSHSWQPATRIADGSFVENSFSPGNASGNVSDTSRLRVGALERDKPYHARRKTEYFTHDDSGNLATDAVFSYQYDAEERLVAVTFPDGSSKKWTYDHQSRRARERMLDAQSTVLYDHYYIYDDWRILAIVDANESASNGIIKTFTWGMDTANTLGAGTGNIGGLLAIDNWTTGEQHQVGYDAMGNVSLLVNAATGAMTAGMEYSPFGELVRTTGNWRETPFLYSTKWHLDYGPQSGNTWPLNLYDYGLRVYDPANGRFITRDPIGDAGGSNLYAFVGNDPVNRVDFLGLNTSHWSDDMCYEGEVKVNGICMPYEYTLAGIYESQGGTQRGAWGLGGGINFQASWTSDTYTDGFHVTFSRMPYDSMFLGSTRARELAAVSLRSDKPEDNVGNRHNNGVGKWRPNDIDCRSLYDLYKIIPDAKGTSLFRIGDATEFGTLNEALINAAVRIHGTNDAGHLEFGGAIHIISNYDGGLVFYFTEPTRGEKTRWGRTAWSRRHTLGREIVLWYHSHPLDGGSSSFSPEDKLFAQTTGPLALIAPDRSLKVLVPQVYPYSQQNHGVLRKEHHPKVNNVTAFPSPMNLSKIRSCIDAGFGK